MGETRPQVAGKMDDTEIVNKPYNRLRFFVGDDTEGRFYIQWIADACTCSPKQENENDNSTLIR